MDTELFSLEAWTISSDDVCHGPQFLLPVQTLIETQYFLITIESSETLEFLSQLLALRPADLCWDLVHHHGVGVITDDLI